MQLKELADQSRPLAVVNMVFPAFDGLAALQIAQFVEP